VVHELVVSHPYDTAAEAQRNCIMHVKCTSTRKSNRSSCLAYILMTPATMQRSTSIRSLQCLLSYIVSFYSKVFQKSGGTTNKQQIETSIPFSSYKQSEADFDEVLKTSNNMAKNKLRSKTQEPKANP
jgi:hypothetical protein